MLVEARQLPAPTPSPSACFGHVHHHPTSASSSDTIEVTSITAHHLLGHSPPLTPSIVISVASPHRKEAFVVCEWVLEEVKKRVQVWKREWYEGEEGAFVGRDGEGQLGFGGRSTEQRGGRGEAQAQGEGKWKENFPRQQREA